MNSDPAAFHLDIALHRKNSSISFPTRRAQYSLVAIGSGDEDERGMYIGYCYVTLCLCLRIHGEQ